MKQHVVVRNSGTENEVEFLIKEEFHLLAVYDDAIRFARDLGVLVADGWEMVGQHTASIGYAPKAPDEERAMFTALLSREIETPID